MLNWVPALEVFGRYLGLFPITFVLTVTAVKDIFEVCIYLYINDDYLQDYRRYHCDREINHSRCQVWDKYVTHTYT